MEQDKTKEIAEKMFILFQGMTRAYGVYEITGDAAAGEKKTGKAVTVQGTVTVDLWRDHIEGKRSLGIVPIRDDSTCYFGAIDIDQYRGLDVRKIVNEINDNHYPLIPCKSKSGGLHLFAFVSEPIPAKEMKNKLGALAAALGHGKAEIFPKQTEIMAERGDMGSWINMPYFDGNTSTRPMVGADNKRKYLDDFFAAVKKNRLSRKDWLAFRINVLPDLCDGPPCLQQIITKGPEPGHRNETLFNLSVYLKKCDPDNWEKLVDDFNLKYFNPPLQSKEVGVLIKSAQGKDYHYSCDKSPFKDYCNATECRMREFGVGGLTGMPEITGLTKYDSSPPIWFVEVEGGGRLELTTEDLQLQARFQRKCMEKVNIIPPLIKVNSWHKLVQGLLDNVVVIAAPEDTSPRGIFLALLEKFCTGLAQATTLSEVRFGKPYTDENFHYFRAVDFTSFLERMRFKEFRPNKISVELRDIGGENERMTIKNRIMRLWKIPRFEAPEEVEINAIKERNSF